MWSYLNIISKGFQNAIEMFAAAPNNTQLKRTVPASYGQTAILLLFRIRIATKIAVQVNYVGISFVTPFQNYFAEC